jgi:hypothetical protein
VARREGAPALRKFACWGSYSGGPSLAAAAAAVSPDDLHVQQKQKGNQARHQQGKLLCRQALAARRLVQFIDRRWAEGPPGLSLFTFNTVSCRRFPDHSASALRPLECARILAARKRIRALARPCFRRGMPGSNVPTVAFALTPELLRECRRPDKRRWRDHLIAAIWHPIRLRLGRTEELAIRSVHVPRIGGQGHGCLSWRLSAPEEQCVLCERAVGGHGSG